MIGSSFARAAALLAAAALLYGVGLGERGLVSEEFRWAEIAREMRATGDYVHPTINGHLYYDKPLGSYWLIVAASFLTGGVSEGTARLPAAFFGVVGVGLAVLLARKLYDARTALVTGAVLATCFGFAFYARRATADIETTTGVLAAIALFVRHEDRRPGAWVLGLWLVMGATSQTKGLLGFALPVLVLGTYGTWTGFVERRGFFDGNRWFFNAYTLGAVPLGLAVFLAPFLMSSWQSGATDGLGMVYRENVKRFFAPHNHTGPVYLYAGVIFVLAAPWAFFLPAALAPGGGGRSRRLALAYFGALFAFFTISASRRSYYLLPVLPAVALLVGPVLASDSLRPWAARLRAAAYALLKVGAVASGALLLPPAWVLPAPYDQLPPLPLRGLFAAGWAASMAWLGFGRTLPASLGVVALGLAYLFLVALPHADAYRTRQGFAAEVRSVVDPEALALFRARDVVFDLNFARPLPDYDAAEELEAAVRAGQVRWLVVRKRYLPRVGVPGRIVREEAANPWEGLDQLGDKMLLLDLSPPRGD